MSRPPRGRTGGRRSRTQSPLNPVKPSQEICLELTDHTEVTRSAIEFFGTRNSADPHAQAARLADQFIRQNAATLNRLQVDVRRDYDGSDVVLLLESHSAVGAVPLVSPQSARLDLGLVVQPRFPWAGIGPMLAEMGWLVSPVPLNLPLLRRSERRVPAWVLSYMVLQRLKAMLDRLERRFEVVTETRNAPKGRVEWSEYAANQMPRGLFLQVPCTFPDLRDDRLLKGAVRFAIEKQLRALETQSGEGTFIHRLIALAESLLQRVRGAAPRRPQPGEMRSWLRHPLRTDVLVEGLQAVDWTVEERGLAGLSDLEGIPWTMPMDQFFEAWVERVMREVALRTGGVLRSGRRRETVFPLAWDPAPRASQGSLVPDLMLESNDLTVIVDAKYKRHWEELQRREWAEQAHDLREQHRADMLQVLAYANLSAARRTVCCLVYPCSPTTWDSLRERGRLFHRAQVPCRERNLELWLTAMPMSAEVEQVAWPMAERLRAIG